MQGVTAISVSADAKLVASGSLDGTVRIWYMFSGTETKCLEGDSSTDAGNRFGDKAVVGVFTVCFLPEGRQVVSAGEDGIIRVWNLENQKLVKCMKVSSLTFLFFSSNVWVYQSGTYSSWELAHTLVGQQNPTELHMQNSE